MMKHIALKNINVETSQTGMTKTLESYDWRIVLNLLIFKYENAMNHFRDSQRFKGYLKK